MNLVCARCRTIRLDPDDPWCHSCHDSTLTIEAEPAITKQQRIAICRLFIQLGVMHKATRMADLSFYARRRVTDYDQLTAAEADTVTKQLRERSDRAGSWHGVPVTAKTPR
jgi:hypothetical protein